jgi:hypothetical protein
MFDRDQHLAVQLNEAQSRFLQALERLSPGLSAQALQGLYGPGGADLGAGARPAVLEDPSPTTALEEVADRLRRAHVEYAHRAEERCLLGADIGETTAQLVAAMDAAGYSASEARNAHVRDLADGIYHPTDVGGAQ